MGLRRAAAAGVVFAAAAATVSVLNAQVATADRVQEAGWWPTKGIVPRAEFVGAGVCAECHASHAATQQATSMARTLSRAIASEALRANAKLTFPAGRYTYEIATSAGESVYRVSDGSAVASAPLGWAFGVGKVGQSFLFERDGVYREARVSYYDGAHALGFTPGRAADSPATLDEAMGRVVAAGEARRCFGCHATAPVADGTFDPNAATPGVTCEACHGPGRRHAAAIRERRVDEGRAAILNPAKLEPADSVDFCGACHATFWDVKLADEKGIAALRSQPYRLMSSRCWRGDDRRLTCLACHNPHRPLVRDAAAYDTRCLACHAARGTAASAGAERACTIATAGCVTCHMPKYDVPEMHHTFTDHLIRIVR
jgi:hypothetical protein